MMEDESSQNEDGKQLALKNLLFCDGEEPRVQHDDDTRVKLGENDNTDSTSENAKPHASSPSRHSPDPNCAICLGTLENKSFTDSCFHTFCFTCLVEWSKVKAECPLCKQPFKSIVHNVRSIEDYDQYYISSRNTDTSWRGQDGRSFRYRSTLTSSDRWSGRQRYGSFEDSIEYRTHRMIYAPHSVTFPPVRNYIPEYPSTSSFRRHIYESGLRVKPLGDGNTQRYRITSPEYYRQNPACTHRLTPWLNRELLALLYDSESQVTFVLELILALIMRYDIQSEEFYVHIEPYLQHRTNHFIHEFYNYAASCHDMRTYDICAVYEPFSENCTSVVSSPDSDVVALTPSIIISENSASVIQTASSSNLPKRKTKKTSKRQPKLFLRRNQQSNIWQSVLPTTSWSLNSTSSGDSSDYAITSSIQGFLDLGVVAGPSTSGLQTSATQPKRIRGKSFSHVNGTSGSSSDTDDECVVIDVVKPRALRTPEVVNLVSSSEDEKTIDSNDAGDYCVTTEVEETTAQPSKRKEHEEEQTVGEKQSKKKLKHRRKKSVISSVRDDFSNIENSFSHVQTPTSPPQHDQGILSPLPTSVCRTYTESDESCNASKSQELHLSQDSLGLQLNESDKHISCSSSSTECSQNTCESERTSSTHTSKNFSSVSFSGEDVPSSISISSSSSSITQILNKRAEPVFSVVAIKQGSEFTFNCKSLSLTQNEGNKTPCGKWHQNSSSSSSVEESATTFEVSENRGKLRSVICRFSSSDKQNIRCDSVHHTSSHNKKHKHKKKKKKHKHKHHKHSHSLSD